MANAYPHALIFPPSLRLTECVQFHHALTASARTCPQLVLKEVALPAMA